ncbi:MAG: OmpA family protein [Candidatus Competibacteraceae bacterium]
MSILKIADKEIVGLSITISAKAKFFDMQGRETGAFDFDFAGNTPNTRTINISWGKIGAIQIHTDVSYERSLPMMMGVPKSKGHKLLIYTWRLQYQSDGNVLLEPDKTDPSLPIDYGEHPIVSIHALSDNSPKTLAQPWVLVVLRTKSFRERQPAPIHIKKEIKGIGIDILIGERPELHNANEFRFQVYMTVTDKPVSKPKEPKGDIIFDHVTLTYTYEISGFALNKAFLDPSIHHEPLTTVVHREFWSKLPKEIQLSIQKGEMPGGKPVIIEGHADKSGKDGTNWDVGKDRALAVKKVLQQLSGHYGDRIFSIPSAGSTSSDPNSPKINPADRKVIIKMSSKGKF